MMPSVTQLLIVLAIVVVIFGLGKFPKMAGDLAKGIKSFKKGMKEGEDEASEEKAAISKNEEAPSATAENTTDKKDA